MTETLEADALEKVYKYDVSVEVRNVLGDRLARVFPTDVAMWMSRVGFAQCDSTQTIADLQDTIEEKLGIPVHRQRLFYKDMFMDNEDTPIRNLKLMEKRPNMMYVEDQSSVDWLAERKRRFKALETTSLNPLPEMAQRVADLRATAARLVGRLQLIFEAASEDRRTINRAVLLEELQAIMPAVCAEFKDRLQGTELLAAFQALDPNLGDNVSWPTVSKWWKQVVATWEKQAVPAFSKPLVAITPLSPTSSSLRPARRMPVPPPPAAKPPRAATPRKSTAATAADVPKSHAELLSEITMAEWPRPHAKHAARSAEAQASERAAVLYRKQLEGMDANDEEALWPRLGLGIALFTMNKLREAMPHLKYAAEQLPRDARVQYRHAIVQEHMGDWKGALNTLQTVVTLEPHNAMAQRDLGSLLFNRGDIWGAVYHWSVSTKLQPDVLAVRAQLGVVLYILGHDGDATSGVPGIELLQAVGAGFPVPPSAADATATGAGGPAGQEHKTEAAETLTGVVPSLARPRRSSASDGYRPPLVPPQVARLEGLQHLRHTLTAGWTRRELRSQLDRWPVPVVATGDTVFGLIPNRGRANILRTPDFLPIYKELLACDELWADEAPASGHWTSRETRHAADS